MQPPNPQETLVELARRTAMLDAIGYAATQIVGGREWRAGIQELLDRLGLATGVSRVTLFEIHAGSNRRPVESCRYDWAEPGLPRLSDDPRYQAIPLVDEAGELDEWTRRRQRGEAIQAVLSELSGVNRRIFIEQNTKSFVSVPILLRSGLWGFLGFDDCRAERTWSRLEIDVLRTAASLIGGAIERADAEERLRLSEERYALAARGANDGLWDWDIGRDRAYFSPRLCQILGLPDDGLRGSLLQLLEHLLAEDAAAMRAGLDDLMARRQSEFEFEGRLRGPAEGTRWIVTRGLIVYADGKPVRLVGALRDISRRKRFERQLIDAQRQRANLARHFSPNMVDELMRAGERLGPVRLQNVTVLFADLFNFTAMTAAMPGEQVIALLREFHALVENAVFGNDGTLDKYMGDGLMATFGTPRPGARDATNAVACARRLVVSLNQWNGRRAAKGQERIQIGIGLHTGEVTLGDVGSERRQEFTVIGDTVNVASRIESMSRALDTAIVASEAVMNAVRREGGEAQLAGFRDLGLHAIRGHKGRLRLRGLTAVSLAGAEDP